MSEEEAKLTAVLNFLVVVSWLWALLVGVRYLIPQVVP